MPSTVKAEAKRSGCFSKAVLPNSCTWSCPETLGAACRSSKNPGGDALADSAIATPKVKSTHYHQLNNHNEEKIHVFIHRKTNKILFLLQLWLQSVKWLCMKERIHCDFQLSWISRGFKWRGKKQGLPELWSTRVTVYPTWECCHDKTCNPWCITHVYFHYQAQQREQASFGAEVTCTYSILFCYIICTSA